MALPDVGTAALAGRMLSEQITNSDPLRAAAQGAMYAPSVHNTQPWRFAILGDRLEVFADRDRGLPVIDPSGRELHISCGAAIYCARVTLRALGKRIQVRLLPDDTNPDHLATIEIIGQHAPSDADMALMDALPVRHTERTQFGAGQLPAALVAEFADGTAAEGAWLRQIDAEHGEIPTAVLLAHADDIEVADAGYRAELAAWSRSDGDVEGIPRRAVPAIPPALRASNYRLRDFSVQAPTSRPRARPDGPPPVERPLVVLLGTLGDNPDAWLSAGQALGWLLLRAAAAGVAASPMTQVLEVASTRSRLVRELDLIGHPQMLLRMGYGCAAPMTHRRPLEELLGAGPAVPEIR
ncbi:MAG TPA: hypothetical protein VGN54_09125 [Mycobacteriales bacterium]|jgi:hypothetical protein|nr:hypothetical protein [Mycobacteriales bacterium]